MDDQLDNILRNRIREVFENFDDPSADEGWMLLREKYPEEQSKRRAFAWLWWGSVAAILLLFLGIGLLVNDSQHPKPEKLSARKVKDIGHINPVAAENHPRERAKLASVESKKTSKTQTINIHATNSNLLTKLQISTQPPAKESLSLNDTSAKNRPMDKKLGDSTTIAFNNKIPGRQLIATTQPNSSIVSPIITQPPPAKSINSMFEKDQEVKAKTADKVKNDSKKVHFAVYATTYFNYAKGSNSQMNLGAGVSSDIKLSKNLKLVTGIAIGQNTLSYAESPPQTILSSAYALSGAASYNMTPSARQPAFTSYNASLVGLDIPLNLKYEFNPQKNDTYVLAGLSSGTFINELYTYHYGYPSEPSLAPDATTHQAFNSFYFAKTLNVAFGVGYPLGKSNRLVIEPFFKYPLDGLGSQQIRFGAGGINLKLNFQPSKK